MRLARRFLYTWGFNIVALFLAATLIDGIDYDNIATLIVAAAVFAAVNMFLKPLVKLLALPLILITLGVALFFINLLMLYLTDWIVSGFSISHFGAAIWATILIWGVNWILQIVFDADDSRRRKG